MSFEQALRAHQHHRAHERKRGNARDCRIGDALDDAFEEGKQDRRRRRAGEIAEAADDYGHEAERQDIDAATEIDGRNRRRNRAAKAASAKPMPNVRM